MGFKSMLGRGERGRFMGGCLLRIVGGVVLVCKGKMKGHMRR
jgi:hypothetical protein